MNRLFKIASEGIRLLKIASEGIRLLKIASEGIRLLKIASEGIGRVAALDHIPLNHPTTHQIVSLSNARTTHTISPRTFIRVVVPIRPDVAVTIAHSRCHIFLHRHQCVRPSDMCDMEYGVASNRTVRAVASDTVSVIAIRRMRWDEMSGVVWIRMEDTSLYCSTLKVRIADKADS